MDRIAETPVAVETALDLLDLTYYRLAFGGRVPETLDDLFFGLQQMRRSVSQEEWADFIVRQCRPHPVSRLLCQDPLTQRASAKPRGYAGDAVTIDLLYKHPSIKPPVRGSTTLGREIYRHNSTASAAQAVISRRNMISSLIDVVALRVPCPHILSVGCGHLREAEQSAAVKANRVGKLVGLDHDRRSLAQAQADLNVEHLHLIERDVLQIIRSNGDLGKFDLIYAAGLFDYLPQNVGARLVKGLFDALNLGGELIFCNVLPDMVDAAYMKCFMDWRLIYRTSDQVEALASRIDATQIDRTTHFRDEFGVFYYVHLRKA